MFDLGRLPIRRKLMAISMATSISVLLVSSIAFLVWDYFRARADLVNDIRTQAAIVADNSTAALEFRDPVTALAVLGALESNPEIVAATVYDAAGNRFAHYERFGGSAGPMRAPAANEALFAGDVLRVTVPVVLDNNTIGTTLVEASLEPLNVRVRLGVMTVALVLVVAIALAFLLSATLQRLVSDPILALTTTAQDVGRRKDYSVRASRQTDDELGTLVDAFNGMLSAVESRDRELQGATRELEQRVESRTAQLQRELAERRRAEEELAERNEALVRTNQELDDFAYVASHDLKEPLRGIHNYAVFLEEDYAPLLDEDGRAKLATLQRLTRRLEGLIDALLHYSRVGRIDLAVRRADLDEVVAEARDSLQHVFDKGGAEVRVQPLPAVRCDRVLMTEVFQNLLGNAVKYNDKARKIVEVGVTDDLDGGAPAEAVAPAFFVRDNGIGIPARHLDSVFRIFKRLHPRDHFGGGTGAGLTIVRKIIERHGGHVWIRSSPGEGTTVYFTIATGVEL